MIKWFRIETSDATHRHPVVPIVVVRGIDVATIEVEVVSVVAIVGRSRPIIAVAANIVERTVNVATIYSMGVKPEKSLYAKRKTVADR